MKLIWATLPFLNSLKIAGFVSREIFIFKILGRVHSLAEAFLGEIIVFLRKKAESAIFNPSIYRNIQA